MHSIDCIVLSVTDSPEKGSPSYENTTPGTFSFSHMSRDELNLCHGEKTFPVSCVMGYGVVYGWICPYLAMVLQAL